MRAVNFPSIAGMFSEPKTGRKTNQNEGIDPDANCKNLNPHTPSAMLSQLAMNAQQAFDNPATFALTGASVVAAVAFFRRLRERRALAKLR